MKKQFITFHHTAMYANDDVAEQFNAVNEGHRKRWNGKTKSKMGFYGGYHYIVERNGAIQQFRGEDETGAHNNVSLMNYRAIGVCFAGNMSRQNLSDAQIVSGVRLIKGIQARHNILDKNIKPHRFYKATQCPGNNFADPVWDYLQEKHESMSPKQEGWKKKEEKWASKYIKDMPGFLASYDPHKMIALIHRAIEDKQ